MQKPTRLIQLCCGTIFLLLGVRFALSALDSNGSMIITLAIAVFFFILSYGLFKAHRWVLRSSAFMFLMSALVLPIGIFNPFTAGDYLAAGKQPPDVKYTLLWLIPVEILLLAVAYMLDPKRGQT